MRRPVSSNGPLFRRGQFVWDVEGTIAAEYRANVRPHGTQVGLTGDRNTATRPTTPRLRDRRADVERNV
jgi:hypothetical protein